MPENTEDIIHSINQGSQAAFRQLVEKYQAYAFALAFRIVCNAEDAKDVVQESFIRIWKSLENYDPTSKFTTWMYTIVTHTAIDRLRKNRRKHAVSIDHYDQAFVFSDKNNPEKKLSTKELGQMIGYLAARLPEKQRLVFILRDVEGFGTEETAAVLNLPASAIKSNLYHARKAVRRQLERLTGQLVKKES